MPGVIVNNPKQAFQDNDGGPASGYLLYTYDTGTATPATTWQDQGQLAANTNPIELDARGECLLWLTPGKEYRLMLTTPEGTVVWTVDDVSGPIALADQLPPEIANPAGHSGPLIYDPRYGIVWLDSGMDGRNRLLNSNFVINQRGVSGTQTLGPNIYAHDRWKSGPGGCVYSFHTSANITTVTIEAGTLIQVIEGVNTPPGTNVCTLSWVGTAQGRAGLLPFSPSPLSDTLIGGSDLVIEFGIGTLSIPQFEVGPYVTPYSHNLYDEETICKRYYQRIGGIADNDVWIEGYAPGAGQNAACSFVFPAAMRASPAVTSAGTWLVTNTAQPVASGIGAGGFVMKIISLAAGAFWCASVAGQAYWKCDAEIY